MNSPAHIRVACASALILVVVGMSACQRVIDVNLNSSSPRVVVEGSISDQLEPCVVSLTQSVDFGDANVFPPVRGAVILLSDNAGGVDTLAEALPGVYESRPVRGVPGRTYTLSINITGKLYVATCAMPQPVEIDSITQQKIDFERLHTWYLNVYFKDPGGVKNYYRFVETVNGEANKSVFLYDDRLLDGRNVIRNLIDDNDTLRANDTVLVSLQCIDGGVYDYFRTLRQATGGGRTASPGNPLSNVTNGALGYFSAYAVRSKRVVIR